VRSISNDLARQDHRVSRPRPCGGGPDVVKSMNRRPFEGCVWPLTHGYPSASWACEYYPVYQSRDPGAEAIPMAVIDDGCSFAVAPASSGVSARVCDVPIASESVGELKKPYDYSFPFGLYRYGLGSAAGVLDAHARLSQTYGRN